MRGLVPRIPIRKCNVFSIEMAGTSPAVTPNVSIFTERFSLALTNVVQIGDRTATY